jgi:hypothetical protein
VDPGGVKGDRVEAFVCLIGSPLSVVSELLHDNWAGHEAGFHSSHTQTA